MAEVPAENVLNIVQTVAKLMAGAFPLRTPYVGTANKELKDFNKEPKQLGDKIYFSKPTNIKVREGIKAIKDPYIQRKHEVTADVLLTASVEFREIERIFHNLGNQQFLNDEQNRFIDGIARGLEAMLVNHVGGVGYGFIDERTDDNPNGRFEKVMHPESGPNFWFGSETVEFLSLEKLVQAHKIFQELGTAYPKSTILLDAISAQKVKHELMRTYNTPNSNDSSMTRWNIASIQELSFEEAIYSYEHAAGYVGEKGQTLTIKSYTKDSKGRITSFVAGGVSMALSKRLKSTEEPALELAPVTGAVLPGDLGRIIDESGSDNIRTVDPNNQVKGTMIPLQFRVTDKADSDASGDVIIKFKSGVNGFIGLDPNDVACSVIGGSKDAAGHINLVGRKIKIISSHNRNLYSSNGHYVAAVGMERLAVPVYATAADPATGFTIEITGSGDVTYHTSKLAFRVLSGMTMVPDYTMALISKISSTTLM